MSHHIHMLPQFLPIERPLKPDKKRRLRKARGAGQSAPADEVDEAGDIDDIFPVTALTGGATTQSAPQEETDQPPAPVFGRAAMNTLLKAQEDTNLA